MRKKGFRIQKGKNKRQQFERERIILTANKEGKGGNAMGFFLYLARCSIDGENWITST